MKTGGTIATAATGVIAALIWRYEHVITEDMLLIALDWVLEALALVVITIISWALGSAATEWHKWRFLEPDLRESPDQPPNWNAPETKRKILRLATAYGGTLALLLLTLWWWPLDWRQALFFLVYGFVVGGTLLPTAYEVGLRVVVPLTMRRLGFKLVETRTGDLEYRHRDHRSDEGDRTVFGRGNDEG